MQEIMRGSSSYLLSLLALIALPIYANTIIQLRDFLCGCEYCETVDTGEPLDIGRHMIMCHSWRDATLKTMKVMEELKREKAEKEAELAAKEKLREDIERQQKLITSIYTWMEDELLGTVYSSPAPFMKGMDRWIYTHDFKWVWTPADLENFLYSYDYGWLYVTKYQWFRVVYWYDRKLWTLPGMVD